MAQEVALRSEFCVPVPESEQQLGSHGIHDLRDTIPDLLDLHDITGTPFGVKRLAISEVLLSTREAGLDPGGASLAFCSVFRN